MNFLNSDWFRRFIASSNLNNLENNQNIQYIKHSTVYSDFFVFVSSNRTTCPPRNFARDVNKSHVAVNTYPNIVTGENQ